MFTDRHSRSAALGIWAVTAGADLVFDTERIRSVSHSLQKKPAENRALRAV